MPTFGAAFEFLENVWAPAWRGRIESVYGREHPGSMLYVGHRSDTSPWWHRTFAPLCGISRLAVIDLVSDNAQSANGITSEIYVGDVRNFEGVGSFDLIFWDEGPEHMPREEALALIAGIRDTFNRDVLVSCPWGLQPQGSGPSDPEFHHWGPDPADFLTIGMQSRTFGTRFTGVRDAAHGNLIAWTD